MTTCCEWLKRMIAKAGWQGTAVIAIRESNLDLRRFYIQARTLTEWQQKVWGRLLSTEPAKTQLDSLFRNEAGGLQAVVVGMRVPILYCPHCGTNLERLIRRHQEEFDALAESHLPFADD